MPDLAMFDIFLRGAALGALVLCACIFLSGRVNRKNLSVATLCLCLCPYLIVSTPDIPLHPMAQTVLIWVASLVPVLLYWAALELFQDQADVRPWQISLAVIVVASAWLSHLHIWIAALRGIAALVLLFHMLSVVIRGDANDLIAQRRRFRRWFLVWVLGLASVITAVEILQLDRTMPRGLFVLQAGVIFLSAAAFLVWSAYLRPDIWRTAPSGASVNAPANPTQAALAHRIQQAMEQGLWRHEGLTVAQLAAHLHTPEHRIRAAINQGMGHRNFPSYVNTFRITEAQKLLTEPEMEARTVLSIAFDVGFSSLGPFNRAFRDQTGTTPTAFRKQHLERTITLNANSP